MLKWRDRRDVLMISTKHTNKSVKINRNGKTIEKPQVIVDFNAGKGFIELNDQIGSYHTSLRKSIKWYRKLIIDLICNISMLNAFSLYIGVTGEKMKIINFREAVIEGLLENENDATREIKRQQISLEHQLDKSTKTSRCKTCYKLLAKTQGN